jgi:hypothetical protein
MTSPLSETTLGAFRAELAAIDAALDTPSHGKLLKDEALRERLRTLFRIWAANLESHLGERLTTQREFLKLSAEIEAVAKLASKQKPLSEYKKRMRRAIQLWDSLVIYLPPPGGLIGAPGANQRTELFLKSIPDVPLALVPNAILGWRAKMESFLATHPFDRSVFIMIRYRKRNDRLIAMVKRVLEAAAFTGVLASEHSITDDLYNPVACLLCCSRGVAIFDKAEERQEFNPNVAYELGMFHLLGRSCVILKHQSLRTLQSDILMKLYQSYSNVTSAETVMRLWVQSLGLP